SWITQTQVLDSAYHQQIDSIDQKVYREQLASANGTNKFYFIEAPVEISYSFIKSKFGIGASIGVAPAWLMSEKGYYLSRDLSGVESIFENKSLNHFLI